MPACISCNSCKMTKADPDLTQDIAYIYEILHCNHFIILSKATEYETTTIVVVSYAVALLRMMKWLQWRIS